MTIEQDLFKRYTVNKNLLKKYGFKVKNKKLVFETVIKNEFTIVIEYDEQFSSKIFDISTGDEYTNFRIKNSCGFSSEIREEFISILTDIRDKCAEKQLFQTKQAMNINKYIKQKYNDEPEFLWKNLPTYAVYRNKKNNKWYAIIGTVPVNKVNKDSYSKEIAEVMNVKIDKNEIKSLLLQKGIYEAYHMNKKNWISIILDGTMKDSEIKKFIDKSYHNI